jgi:hypothetical protein
VTFKLTDTQGNPIEDAKIHFSGASDDTLRTDADGTVQTTIEGANVEATYRGLELEPDLEATKPYTSSHAEAGAARYGQLNNIWNDLGWAENILTAALLVYVMYLGFSRVNR